VTVNDVSRGQVTFGLGNKKGDGMNRKTLAVALVVVLVLGGVLFAISRREGDPSLNAKVAEMIPQIEGAMGLKFKTPPVVDSRSREEVRSFLVAQLEDSATARELEGQELVLKRLGLMEESQSLKQLYLDVLEEQIAGYYDPKTEVLYLVDGTGPEIRDITLTHELVHALQDQYFPLDSIQDMRGQDDRQLAAHAVMEGQATLEQMVIMFGQDLNTLIPGGWESVRQMIRDEQVRMPRFAAAPIVVQEMLLFPYLAGADFVRRFKEHRPGENVLENIPLSTEQLLHTTAFLSGRDDPSEIQLPPLNGHTALYENSMGEFGTRIFLYEHLRRAEDALRGAMGWDGDRYVLFRAGESTGIAWVSVWDSNVEAAEFRDQVARHLETSFRSPRRRLMPGDRRPGALDGMEYIAEGRIMYLAGAEIGGRPAVIYVDVPEGSSTAVFDIRQVQLTERER
jgi:hypothetical protein